MVQLRCPVIVGRDGERATLDNMLQATAHGGGGMAAVVGEPGVGKSRLVRALAERAQLAGVPALVGRAANGGSPAALRPLVEALLAGLRTRRLTAQADLEPFRSALGRVLPPLRSGGSGESRPADEATPVLSEGVLRLLRALAGHRGLLLLLEDMHRADVETLAVLEYLADHLAGEPVLVVITLRPEATEWLDLVRGLQARGAATTVELGRLDEAAVAGMVRACLDAEAVPEAVLDWLSDLAEGVPLFVEELLATAIASGSLRPDPAGWTFSAPERPVVPATSADAVRGGLATLDDTTDRVVRCAAVLGTVFDARLLPALSGHSSAEVTAALRRAGETHLVMAHEADHGTHRFSYALTREALLGELPAYQRRDLAGAALQLVTRTHPELGGAWCDVAAALAVAADDRSRAAALLLESGRRALLRGALPAAQGALQRARGYTGDELALARVEILLLQALEQAGQLDRAGAVGARLLGVLDDIGATAGERADVALSLTRAAGLAGDWELARRHLDRARAEAPGDAATTARVAAAAADVAVSQAHDDEAAALAGRALREASRVGFADPRMADVACEAYEVLGRAARTRDLAAAETSFSAALRVAERHHLPHRRLRALRHLGSIDLLEALRTERLQRATHAARSVDALGVATSIELDLAAVLALQMRLPEALDIAMRCERTARRFPVPGLAPMAFAVQAVVHALALRRQEMETAITAALGCPDVDDNIVAGLWGQARAEYSLGCEDRARALSELDTAMGHLRGRSGSPWPLRGLWALLRTLDDAGGDIARAEVAGAPWGQIRIIRAQLRYADAISAGRDKRPEQALAAFAAAEREMAGLAGTDWLRNRARRLVAEAAVADGWGQPAAWLRPALDTFTRSGHRSPAAACRALLRRQGESVPRGRAASVPEVLYRAGITAREMDVLRLLGEQLPNLEIAARLVISPRTVEKHVERLLTKTMSASRHELAALAARYTDGPGDLRGRRHGDVDEDHENAHFYARVNLHEDT